MSKSLEQSCGAPDGDAINNRSELEKQLSINKQMNEAQIGLQSISDSPIGHSAFTPASTEEGGSSGTHDSCESGLLPNIGRPYSYGSSSAAPTEDGNNSVQNFGSPLSNQPSQETNWTVPSVDIPGLSRRCGINENEPRASTSFVPVSPLEDCRRLESIQSPPELSFPDCNTKPDVDLHNVQFTGSKMFKCSGSNGTPKPLMDMHGAPRGPRLYRPYPVRVATTRAQAGTPNNKLKPRLNKDHGNSRSNEVTPSILEQILEDNASSGTESASDMRAQNPRYHVGQLQFPLVPIDPSLFRLRLQRLNNNEDRTRQAMKMEFQRFLQIEVDAFLHDSRPMTPMQCLQSQESELTQQFGDMGLEQIEEGRNSNDDQRMEMDEERS